MIPMLGPATPENWTAEASGVWRVAQPDEPLGGRLAELIENDRVRPGAGLYLWRQGDAPGGASEGVGLRVSNRLAHIAPGDVISVSQDGRRIAVAWKASVEHNSILLTERCEHACVMCSQPPKDRDDGYLYDHAKDIIGLLPAGARALTLTGGEPTTDRRAFLEVLAHIRRTQPSLRVHVLSNGRSFRDPAFAAQFAGVATSTTTVGIPLYGAESNRHDYVVQSDGAFTDTVRGIIRLAERGIDVELRVVLLRATVPALMEVARFVVRNLPFVSQVSLMGLEMIGYAKSNSDLVWIDPFAYRSDLRAVTEMLTASGLNVRIFNHPLCIIDPVLWPFADRSISDWKRQYPAVCCGCAVRDACGGVFGTSGSRVSAHLAPVAAG